MAISVPAPIPYPYPAPPSIEQIVQGIMDLVRQIERAVDDFVRIVNWALDQLNRLIFRPIRWVADRIIEAWNRFVAVLQEVWAVIRDVLDNPGSPTALWEAGRAWVQQVGDPLVAEAASVSVAEDEVASVWKGVAGDAYKAALPRQSQALASFESSTSQIGDGLAAAARAIIEFYIEYALATTGYVSAMIGALAASGTIVGIPAGIVIAVGASVAYIAAAAALSFRALSNFENATQTLLQADTQPGLGTEWPSLSAVITGDGSITDGDDSDWRLRP